MTELRDQICSLLVAALAILRRPAQLLIHLLPTILQDFVIHILAMWWEIIEILYTPIREYVKEFEDLKFRQIATKLRLDLIVLVNGITSI